MTDYLIWLIDMDNDPLTNSDIEFIDSLGLQNKILIVFNKAELKSDSDRIAILKQASEDVKQYLPQKVFGIAAYSAHQRKEFTGHVIQVFFQKGHRRQGAQK